MMVAVTGASASGKSAFAEQCLVDRGEYRRIYVATMIAWDEECKDRIKKHRNMRQKKQFETLECPFDLERADIPEGSAVLLECLSNLTANELYRDIGHSDIHVEDVRKKILKGILHIKDRAGELVIVTNEVFGESPLFGEETEKYRRLLGELNRDIFELADQVYLVEAGIPMGLNKSDICFKKGRKNSMILLFGGAYQGKTGLALKMSYIAAPANKKETAVCLENREASENAAKTENREAADGWSDPLEAAWSRPVILNLHGYIKRFSDMEDTKAREKMRDFIYNIIKNNPNACITADEIGSGIVPIEREDRLWRELCGEAVQLLAAEAEEVFRVIGGIPMRLKGGNE